MGRAKLAMEYIKKDKSRSTTFEKRKKGLKKKAQELATLCDVPLCVIVYQGPDSEPDTFPANRAQVLSVIDRYASVPREESAKRNLNLQAVLESKKKAADKQRSKRQENTATDSGNNAVPDGCCYGYPTWLPELEGLSKEQLSGLAAVLDGKLKAAEGRLAGLRGGFGDYGGSCNAIVSANGTGMQWPMYGGSSASSTTGGSAGSWQNYYDHPNVMMGPKFYYGQVGPHGTLVENAAFGGGGARVAQPMPAVYGCGVKFEPQQMGGGGLGLVWFEDDGRFML